LPERVIPVTKIRCSYRIASCPAAATLREEVAIAGAGRGDDEVAGVVGSELGERVDDAGNGGVELGGRGGEAVTDLALNARSV
jgi:hypothetical protein